jgi:hypothetical protein
MPLVNDLGGPILASPRFIPITYDSDPSRGDIEAFVSSFGGSNYFVSSVSEYGAGAGTMGTPVHLSEAAPTTIDGTGIEQWLTGKLDGTHPEFAAPDANTVYILFYPATTTITVQGFVACQILGGYHSDLTLPNKTKIAYAVLPHCDTLGLPQLQGVDAVTGAASHELIEATTDPYPNLAPAYQTVDGDHAAWVLVFGGGEVGDMCAQDPQAFVKPPNYPYTLQRSWSNAQAAAGHDPCVPALQNEVYFNSTPVLDDPVSLTLMGQTTATKGVHIGVGQTKTIDVDLWSDAALHQQWAVAALDLSSGAGGPAELQLKLDAPGGSNGQKVHLAITVLRADPLGFEVFLLGSSLGPALHYWVGLVATP